MFTAAAAGEPKAAAIIGGVTAATEVAVWSLLHTYLPEVNLFGDGSVDSHWSLFEAAAQKSLAEAVLARDEGVTNVRQRRRHGQRGEFGAGGKELNFRLPGSA